MVFYCFCCINPTRISDSGYFNNNLSSHGFTNPLAYPCSACTTYDSNLRTCLNLSTDLFVHPCSACTTYDSNLCTSLSLSTDLFVHPGSAGTMYVSNHRTYLSLSTDLFVHPGSACTMYVSNHRTYLSLSKKFFACFTFSMVPPPSCCFFNSFSRLSRILDIFVFAFPPNFSRFP